MRSAILHIGAEKTGTTAIQAMLASRRGELASLGFCYPSSPGEYSHTALAIYAAPEYAVDLVESLPGGDFNEDAFARALASEMAALPPHVQTVIFSNEHCQSRLIKTGHVAKLQALLAPYFDTITIIVYLRRQDEMACSLYSTRLRGGDVMFDMLPSINPSDLFWASYFNFAHMLERYAGVFGKASVKPRIYEADTLLNGNAVQDFLSLCGLPAWLAEGTDMVNQAIPADGQKFLAALNAWVADPAHQLERDLVKPVRDACVLIAEARLQGQPMRPTRADAQQFYAQFHGINEQMRTTWFADRSRLFKEDFSQYPELAEAGRNTHEAALRAAFTIIEDLVHQNGNLSASLHAQRRAFEASLSWRLTAPLRAVLLALRRVAAALAGRNHRPPKSSRSKTHR